MTAWWEKALRGLTLVALAAFTLAAIGHIVAMWFLRKHFAIALRSPLLACASGLFATALSVTVTLQCIFLWAPVGEFGVSAIISTPLGLTLFQGSYIARALRLLVMYDPVKGRRWSRILQEKNVLRWLLLIACLAEISVLSAIPTYGVRRVANLSIAVVVPFQALTFVGAGALLFRKLKVTDDLFNMSRELLLVGGFAVGGYVCYGLGEALPLPDLARAYSYILSIMVNFQFSVLVTNIMPVREVLRNKSVKKTNSKRNGWAAWRASPGSVHVAGSGTSSFLEISKNAPSTVSALDGIIAFPTLRQAFEEFCRRALCSESMHFLTALWELREGGHGATDEREEFESFLSIVNEYIRDNSPSEVNIDYKTKKSILQYAQRSAYMQLPLEARKTIFANAERHIAKMLADNLLEKFKASDQYQQIVTLGIFLESD